MLIEKKKKKKKKYRKDLDTIVEFIHFGDNSNDVTISIRKNRDLLFVSFLFEKNIYKLYNIKLRDRF